MTSTIRAANLSLGWMQALDHLLNCGGKATNIIVVVEQVHEEIPEIRQLLDTFIDEYNQRQRVKHQQTPRKARDRMFSVATVANTLFPQALYNPHRDNARAFLYDQYEKSFSVLQRFPPNKYGTYFRRMVAYPDNDKTTNQLEHVIHRLQVQLRSPNPLSSAYEISFDEFDEVYEVDDMKVENEGAEAVRVFAPDRDNRLRGFPCLSHISLTLFKQQLHLTALYRNQHFIERAYGNYVGLSRLLSFVCHEVGCEPGELVCIASHADAQLEVGKRAIAALLERCQLVLHTEQES
jgi:thymidylate synthase